jgi:cysteine desulfurase
MTRIYLDHNATTPLIAQAKAAVIDVMGLLGNASSIHTHGRTVRTYIEEARQSLADFFGTKTSQVVFTSGATESNNMVLKGFQGTIITSAIEHDSVLEANKSAFICSVNDQGIVNLNHLEGLLQHTTTPVLVSIMAANNETGVIQPLDQIVTLCRQYGAKIHTDAVQAVGKLNLTWSDFDFISLSAHKIGGLQGIGALIINERIPLFPLIRGGGQERYFRSGTENIAGIVSLGAAITDCPNRDWQAIEALRDSLQDRLIAACPNLTVFSKDAPRLANTLCFATPGLTSNTQVMHVDLSGISVSAGSACSSGKVKTSHVLQAMGTTSPCLDQSLRVSLGLTTTKAEIDAFFAAWQILYSRTKERIAS